MVHKDNVSIYDTTLRDGSQGGGVSFSLGEKLTITQKLDDLGVPFIEGGWPGSNPKDDEYFKKVKELPLKNSKIFAFCSTKRKGSLGKKSDPFLEKLIESKADGFCLFGKAWDLHVTGVLGLSLDENLLLIKESIEYLKDHSDVPIFFDLEHFFDGYSSNKEYSYRLVETLLESKVETIILCDTNGGRFPEEVSEAVKDLRARYENINLGIHAHNDCNLAVANSLVAVNHGCRHVQGTINGLGERCGNADLTSLIPNLQLKKGYPCLGKEQLKELVNISGYIWNLTNLQRPVRQPFVGKYAFSHKGGIHVSAVQKNPQFYEHISPAEVGNSRGVLISELSGRSNLIDKFSKFYPEILEKNFLKKLLNLIQDKEKDGWSFEEADATLELIIRDFLERPRNIIDVDYCRVIDLGIGNREKNISEATLNFSLRGTKEIVVSEGIGPVDALGKCLRKALSHLYPDMESFTLKDYKVRIIDGHCGTSAKVKVFIESQYKNYPSFGTVGISPNIIEASWMALVDAFEYFIHVYMERMKNSDKEKARQLEL